MGDSANVREFYEKLLGWKDGRLPPESVVERVRVALRLEEASPAESLPCVKVENADDIAARVAPLGGTLVRKVTDVPAVGRVGVLADPAGVVLAFVQPVVKA